MFRWTMVVAGLGYWGNVVRAGWHADGGFLALATGGVLANGAFCAAAWLMLAALAWRPAPTRPASARQMAVALAACALCVVPARQASMVALLLLGLSLLGRPASRAAGWLLLGLAAEIVWSSAYMLPLHAAIACLDAAAVRRLLPIFGSLAGGIGNLVDNARSGFGIQVLAPCASSFPLAGVGLAFVVTTLHQGRTPERRDLPWLLLSFLASIVLTECRLAWMTQGEADYVWLHEGGGMTLYTIAALGLAALFPLLATREAPPVRVPA